MEFFTAPSPQVSQSVIKQIFAPLMTSFSAFLGPYPSSDPLMPVVHSASFQVFREIVRSNVLLPRPCTVFKKDLLYLFYGRPAYKVSQTVTSQGQLRHLPVSIILQPHSIGSTTVFPFDTGAHANGLFDSFLKGLDLNNFQLGAFPDSSQKLVSAFYTNNKSYYYGEVVNSLSVAPTDFEVSAYYDMLKDTAISYVGSPVPPDDRRQTIEIQAGSPVDLVATDVLISGNVVVKNNILAVVLPEKALDSQEIMDAVTVSWKAEPITYGLFSFSKPEEYHGVIREKVADLLKRQGSI